MLKDKITCLIFSCDKFSDLWEGNILLMNLNWSDRDFQTIIITDKETDKTIPGIDILAAGTNGEWSDRLAYALKYVTTEYVFFTLDDYFLIEPVDSVKMENLVDLMARDGYDYIRLFPRPKRATGTSLDGYKGLYYIDITCDYSVNLYSGFWRKAFLDYTVRKSLNVWKFEVSLHKYAMEYGARCIVSNNNDYVILDVVRKGRILRRANRYFKKHPGIYMGNRALQNRRSALKLWVKTITARNTPRFLLKILRRCYVKLGGSSFSE